MNNVEKLKIILNHELLSAEGLSFLEVLEGLTPKNSNVIEGSLNAIAAYQKETFDKAFSLMFAGSPEYKNLIKLDANLKVGLFVRELIKIVGVFNGE